MKINNDGISITEKNGKVSIWLLDGSIFCSSCSNESSFLEFLSLPEKVAKVFKNVLYVYNFKFQRYVNCVK